MDGTEHAPARGQARAALRRQRARAWALAALVVAAPLFAVAPRGGWQLRTVAAWDVGSFVLAGLAWRDILRSTPERTRVRAATVDPGRGGVLLVTVLACVAGLFSTVALLDAEGRSVEVLLLGILAATGSWVLVHTAFAVHYAHLYYRDAGDVGGLDFPGGEDPDDVDFAYVAFLVGMSFSTSDVAISDRGIRRSALAHCLLSFAFNSVILALAVNLVIGLLAG